MALLSRGQFRKSVLDRDKHRCVICGDADVKLDAHHIMERKLWTSPHEFGGYYLNNGATLCDRGFEKTNGNYSCHLQAGMTLISPEDCRRAAGIKEVLFPSHLPRNFDYTVWGDPIRFDGTRLRG